MSDKNVIIKGARSFMKTKLSDYLALTGEQRADLKSGPCVKISNSVYSGNSTEKRFLDIVEAEKVVNCVKHAIENCSNMNRHILTLCYLDEIMDKNVAIRLGYSISRYKDLKRQALYEFALRYRYQAAKAGLKTKVGMADE